MSDTRAAILREAGRLFALRGYHGTSTREIADAVGVRQPSLFHHFASKQQIAEALLEYDRSRSPGLQLVAELPDAPPPVRVFQSVRREVLVELTSDYDLRGLYLSALLDEPEFTFWRETYDAAMARARAEIEAGIASGDFVDRDPTVVVELMDALINQAVRWGSQGRELSFPDEAAELALRLVLRRPSRIAAIRSEANRRLEEAGTPWPDLIAARREE